MQKFGFSLLLVVCLSLPMRGTTLYNNVVSTAFGGGSGLAAAADGRVFVITQTGDVRIVDPNGGLLPVAAGNISSPPFTAAGGEYGLIGIALDPSLTATGGFIYLDYTIVDGLGNVHNRVSRFTMANNELVANSELVLYTDPNGNNTGEHTGGGMVFGPDGKLYVGVGDRDDKTNGQNPTYYWGDILQLDPLVANQTPVVFATGLRNPFSLSFLPGSGSGTGLMFINDVGANAYEEINAIAFGGSSGPSNTAAAGSGPDFGWPVCEGPNLFGSALPCGSGNLPVHYYSRTSNDCAITGGSFYKPSSAPVTTDFEGEYLFLDWCSGEIQSMNPTTAAINPVYQLAGYGTTSLAVSSVGNIFYLNRGTGELGYLTAVPEPGTLALMAAALTLVLVRYARRASSSAQRS